MKFHIEKSVDTLVNYIFGIERWLNPFWKLENGAIIWDFKIKLYNWTPNPLKEKVNISFQGFHPYPPTHTTSPHLLVTVLWIFNIFLVWDCFFISFILGPSINYVCKQGNRCGQIKSIQEEGGVKNIRIRTSWIAPFPIFSRLSNLFNFLRD